ncbi:hypothetical protein WJX72_000618 [[Myrmecia] bisecta]|uniref:BRCT domain-containing protein n=1 Tax=[Myrmecia] bisecta TaxID=41462 RepID=A0AAW1R4Q7_9CHLO
MSHPTFSKYLATGGPKVVYHAPASESYLCCVKTLACLTVNWLVDCKEMLSRKYVTVYENKVEYNETIPFCFCCMIDNTHVQYFDRPLTKKATRAGCCTPCCTHCSFFPTCCDACGEGVVIHGQSKCAARRSLPCRSFQLLCGFDDADRLAAEINNARNAFHGYDNSGTVNVRVQPAEAQAMKR